MGLLPQPALFGAFLLLLMSSEPLSQTGPSAALWTIPAILLSSMMIAWAAESAQFFVAQGFALAMLAWLQTLPEFAAEAVLAWHREVPFLLAGLTGALRMLTGLGWPMIYATAAYMNRKRGNPPLRAIRLHGHQAVEVVGLLAPLLYFGVIAVKNSLSVWDAIPLMGIYSVYLWVLGKLPPEDPETIDDLEAIPRKIVLAPRGTRIFAIVGLFLLGGVLIQQSTAPFVGSLFSLSMAVGIPTFVFMQWVMPLVSEFPEMASTFYWAETVDRAPMALMNMVSSNINQWTMLPAMLPIVLSISARTVTPIVFDPQQKVKVS